MSRYLPVLAAADRHFARVAEARPDALACRSGCTGCCHGLFEIARVDVTVLAEGLAALAPAERADIERRAEEILRIHPHPVDWSGEPEGARELFFEETAELPCPCLGEDGRCRVYAHRPLMCRTFGLPIRDGERYIGDECELNFREATEEEKRLAAWDLAQEEGIGDAEELTIPQAIRMARVPERAAGLRGGSGRRERR